MLYNTMNVVNAIIKYKTNLFTICSFIDCVLSAVGKPVFNRYSVAAAGCWMREPVQGGVSGEKYWVTRMEDTNHLYEFSNRTAFAKGHPTRNFTLPFPFKVNKNTILYNNWC